MASEERGTARLLGATVYHTEDEAIAIAYPSATRVSKRNVVLDSDVRERISQQVGYRIKERIVVLHEAWQDEAFLGRALALDEVGKTLPFRFLVALRPDGAVDQVLLLTYRESRGHEIERAMFRAQYEGKTLRDPIRRGDDIRNVSGATISVDALSRGVRRALAIGEALAPAGPGPAPAQPEAAK